MSGFSYVIMLQVFSWIRNSGSWSDGVKNSGAEEG
jgi:hypothetical protein